MPEAAPIVVSIIANSFFFFEEKCTVEPQFNEVPRDSGNWFIIWRVCYNEVLTHTFYCNFLSWLKYYRLTHQGLRYIEVH